jgi:CheY-like chemotaxis protein
VLRQVRNCPEPVEVKTEFAEDLLNVKAGAAQISRLVFNLINNGLDAMDGGGTLKIRTENWYADHLSGNFAQVPQGEYVKLTISDTGCGIEREHLDHIFEPFFTTKTTDRRRGSGLGLSVVHAVVQDHDGFIDISSRPSQGTSVYVYLPITRESARVDAPDELRGGSESVLVVDDDPVQCDVSKSLLTRLGYRVSTVNSGEEAVKYLESEPCDLLILDMIMPGGMDGADTLEAALAVNPAQRAVIVSGFAESERVLRAEELGAGAFLKKPLTRSILARAVRAELDRDPV